MRMPCEMKARLVRLLLLLLPLLLTTDVESGVGMIDSEPSDF
jgi:hypothetical protein